MMKKSFLIIAVTLLLLCLFSSAAAASSVDARITYFNPASGTYYPGDSVTSSLSFKNTGTYTWTYWVSYSVQDENGKWYDTPLEPVRVSRRRTTTVTNTWTVPDDALAGEYNIVMNIYKRNGTTKLTSAEKNRAFTIINELEDTPIEDTPVEFSFIDNFDSFNSNNWMKSSFILGRSTLDPANVDVNNGNLRIKLPANTLNGGEIQSVDLYKYGTYSARMKLPNAPSSITGFFMYLGPDFYNEIDIVVYNDNSGNVAFTTYANGKMQHSVTKNMGFDPTDDYHDYKFEFEQGVLNFYVDDKLLQTWTDGMTTNSMHLMVHTLYPQWLEGTKQTSNQYLLVDWIKLDDTPVDDTPVDDTPVDDTPVDDTPVDDTPVDDTPVDDTPVDDTPVDDTPVDDTPVDDTPVDDTPVDDTPVDDTPVEYSFIDNFDNFNSNYWMKSSFKLERSTLDPANVDVKDGNMRIKIPANTLNGGEIQSVDFYKYGTYSARMKLPNAPSSITGFFMYLGPDFYNEVDIEVYNDKSGNVDFTTYANGKMQHSVTKNMGFDPTAGYHDYKFEFEQGVLNFYVDDKLLQTWTDGMTTNSMYLMVNTWFPQWLQGTKTASDQYLLVDWIKVS